MYALPILKIVHNVQIIDLQSFVSRRLPKIETQLKTYGYMMLDIDVYPDAETLYTHYVLKEIFDFLKNDISHAKNCFYLQDGQLTTRDKKIANILNYIGFRIFTSPMHFIDFLNQAESNKNSSLIAEFVVFSEKLINAQRPPLSKIRKYLKRYNLNFLATQYFNDYNAKLLLIK